MADKDLDTITIDIGEDVTDLYLNSTMSATSYNFNAPTNYSIGATGSAGSFLTSNGANGTSWNTYSTASNPGTLSVTGNAEFEGDVKIKGVSIAKTLEDIQSRLAILVPDPAKLEHFASLKKAYEHYKTLEALCEIPTTESKE
jgi:hypothetical protein